MRSAFRAPRRRRRPSWDHFIPIVADAAQLYMGLRNQPRPLDWIAFATRTAALGVRAHAQFKTLKAPSPWEYFDDDEDYGDWTEIPYDFRALVMRYVEGVSFDDAWWDGDPSSDRIALGHVDGHAVGWLQSSQQEIEDGPYIRRGNEAETYAAVGRAAWRTLGTDAVVFGPRGLVADPLGGCPFRPSAQTRQLLRRLLQFRRAGINRSVLLVGPPGTGKSHAIRALAHGLRLRTLRVEVSALLDSGKQDRDEVNEGLDTLVSMLAPGVLVLDDIDRIGSDARLLRFLEEASAARRIVLASANGTSNMLGALLRPGRFDEVVTFDKLDRSLLEEMLGADADLAPRLEPLPMAYAREFVVRRDVLGRAAAEAELDSLVERAKRTAEAD
ncbi:MAG: ATP-binding protein [Myxococcota bacterium]